MYPAALLLSDSLCYYWLIAILQMDIWVAFRLLVYVV